MKMQVRLLGVPEICIDGEIIASTQWTRADAKPLLFVLLLKSSHKIARNELCKLLWPALDRSSARTKLTNTLYSLRKALGSSSERLIATVDSIELRWDESIEFDVEQFERRLDAAACCADPADKLCELQGALGAYRGSLMEGWSNEPWIAQDREVLKARYLWALDQLVGLYSSQRLQSDAIRYQRLRVNASLTDQAAHAKLLMLLLEVGSIEDAAAHYKACRDILATELGVAPSEAIQTLYGQIKQGIDASRNAPTVPKAVLAEINRASVMVDGKTQPIQELALLGRDRDTNLLSDLLDDAISEGTFVTITGLGGVGKTSVARQVMNRWVQKKAARFLDLSEIASVETAAELIKISLALPLSLLDSEKLVAPDDGHERVDGLLVVDNFEHLVVHASVLNTLLKRCPRLTLLVTSRIPLRLPGETIYPLSPLDVNSDAIKLFVKRARKQSPKRIFNEPDFSAAADICKLLDGLPLAIELAAARTRLFEPAELAARLQTDLKILRSTGVPLGGNRRDSLWAILAWSVDLLNPPELTLLVQLTAFQGGFNLAAVQAVFSSAEANVPDLFEALIEHQLVVEVRPEHVASTSLDAHTKLPETPRRWNLLETVRQYVATVAEAAVNADAIKTAHSQYYIQEITSRLKADANSIESNSYFVGESHNILAALDHAFAENPTSAVTPLLQALDKLRFNGHWFAITRWIKRLRSLSPELLDTDQHAQLDVLTLVNFNFSPENQEVVAASRRLARLIESGARLTDALQIAVANIAMATAAKGQPTEALHYLDNVIEQAESRQTANVSLSVLHATKIRLETSAGRWSELAIPIETLISSLANTPEALFYVERALATRLAFRGDFEHCLLALQRLTARSTWLDHQADLQIHAVMFAHHALKPTLALTLIDELEARHAARPSFDSNFEFDIIISALSLGLLDGQGTQQKAALAMNRLHNRMQSGTPFTPYYSEHLWYVRTCLSKDYLPWLGSALSALATSGIRYPFIWASHFTELLGVVATVLRNEKVAMDCFLFSQEARARVRGSLSPLEKQTRAKYGIPLEVGGVDERYKATPLEVFSGVPYWERVRPNVLALRDTAISVCDLPKLLRT